MSIDDLYERDFYVWTQEQAKALRDRGRGDNRIDWDRLAEEVGDLGKSERNAVFSNATRVIQHLYYLAWTQRTEPVGGWKAEVAAFRQALRRSLTPSIRRQLARGLEQVHADAAEIATLAFGGHEPGASMDTGLRWSLEQVLGETDDPVT
jgi:hypothetical protein